MVTVLAVCTDGPALCTLHATVAWMLDATTWTQDLREERKWQERRPDSLLCDSFADAGNFSSTQVDTMVLAET